MTISSPYFRRGLQAALIALAAWAALALFNQYRVHFPNREHAMIPALQDMQTFCVGRYLIDLPRGSTLYRAISSAGGAVSVEFETRWNVPHHEFRALVEERWDAVRKVKVDDLGKPFTQPPERIEVVENAVVIMFNHHARTGRWPGGFEGTLSFYDTEGYLWKDNLIYEFTGGRVKDRVIAAMHRLQQRQNADLPASDGFCAGEAFFPGAPENGESTDFAFHLATNPRVEFRIGTMGGGSVKQNPAMFALPDFKMRFVRDARRTVSDLEGEEWAYFDAQDKQETAIYGLSAFWQHPHGKDYLRNPDLNLRMEIDVEVPSSGSLKSDFPAKKADGDIGKEEFMALWDGVLKTLRIRPFRDVAEPAPAAPPATPSSAQPARQSSYVPPVVPKLPLGSTALSLQRCPETGLWECAADPAIGDKRRFIAQGMTMPSVMVHAPGRSLWQKLKGETPNLLTETTWTLLGYGQPEA